CLFWNEKLVHFSEFTPRYWRFPFLEDNDIQIGDSWTDPMHRGRGLRKFAVDRIVRLLEQPGRRFWCAVESTNRSSIRAIESAQFAPVARGRFVKPWGLGLLGAYRVDAVRSPARTIVSLGLRSVESMPVQPVTTIR